MTDVTNEIAPFGGIAYINGLALQIAYPNATGAYWIYNGMNGELPLVEDALRSGINQAGIEAIDRAARRYPQHRAGTGLYARPRHTAADQGRHRLRPRRVPYEVV
jgi:hypothetical protein